MEAVMKNVLVLMHDDAGQEARFQCALDLTRAINGHLTCLDVAMMPMAVEDFGVLGGAATLIADEQANEAKNRTRMQARIADEDVAYDWIDVTGDLAGSLRNASAMIDVIVVNRQLDSDFYPDMLGTAADVVVKSGKPVLAVPESARRFNAFGAALVAWDGSREAEAALRAAVPLLQLAERVTILEVDDGSIKVAAFDAAEYLSRHGIKARILRQTAATDVPSTIILNEAEAMAAAYVVMGGFGHSRFAEAMLGGVTRRMLRESPVPLFLAH
jgi:nucleotide-binding universal stress UspA family protein